MSIGQRWQIFKWTFVSLFFANVLLVTTGLVFVIYFYQHQENNVQKQTRLLNQNQEILQTLTLLNQLKTTDQIENYRYPLYEALKELTLKNEESAEVFKQFQSKPLKQFQLENTNSAIERLTFNLNNNFKTLQNHRSNDQKLKTLFITSILCSLFFGLFLPLLVFFLISKAIIKGQAAIIRQARSWAADIKSTLDENSSDQKFRNIHFWLQFGLVNIVHLSQLTRHPAMAYLAEILKAIQSELRRENGEENTVKNMNIKTTRGY